MDNLIDILPVKYRKYNVTKIESGASRRFFYRLFYNNHSVICIDSSKEQENYKKFLKVYKYLSKINISTPEIYETNNNYNIIILEDFGKQRFDKILSKYPLKKLLHYAVDTLLVINKEMTNNINLQKYNFQIFKSEISELIEYYYPYVFKKKAEKNIVDEFFHMWKESYKSMDFDFSNFVHKDFNINNLMYLSNRKNHLKCGVLDFQNAFLGENCWDLFSLLEDSRVMFNNKFNNYFLEYYYKNLNQKCSFNEFKEKYYFLSSSRQTRLLGRWIKLSIDLNQKWYLKFIPTTKKRLIFGINNLNNKNLKSWYNKIIF